MEIVEEKQAVALEENIAIFPLAPKKNKKVSIFRELQTTWADTANLLFLLWKTTPWSSPGDQ